MPTVLGADALIPPDDHFSSPTLDQWWQWMRPEQRAIHIRLSGFDVSDAEIARMVGVTQRTLLRWDRYQEVKAFVESRPAPNTKWRGRTRRPLDQPWQRGFSDPYDPGA